MTKVFYLFLDKLNLISFNLGYNYFSKKNFLYIIYIYLQAGNEKQKKIGPKRHDNYVKLLG
jgi:hypothetical protein